MSPVFALREDESAEVFIVQKNFEAWGCPAIEIISTVGGIDMREGIRVRHEIEPVLENRKSEKWAVGAGIAEHEV